MASSEVPRAFEAEDGGVEEIAPALVASKVVQGRRPAFSAAGLNLKSAPKAFAAGALRVLIERCWDQTPELRPSFKVIERELAAVEDMRRKEAGLTSALTPRGSIYDSDG